MKQKFIKLVLLLALATPLPQAIADAPPFSHKFVHIDEQACQSIIELKNLLPHYEWSETFKNLCTDINDGGNVAFHKQVEGVVNECLLTLNNQQQNQLRPLQESLEAYKTTLDSGKAYVQLNEIDNESGQAQTRRKRKKFCSICVRCECVRFLTVTGSLTVNGNETISGNLTIGGTVTIGNTILTSTPGGLGITGATGATGTIGATGATGGIISSAQYAQIGAQPGSIAANQPFTYTTAVLTSPSIIASTGTFAAFPASGTVFQLANIGRYEINYQVTYPTDGGVVLAVGPNLLAGSMTQLSYSMIGKTPDGQVAGSVIIQTTTVNSFVAVVAGAGNVAPIQPGPNSSTTNANSTTVSIKQIA